MGTTRVNALDFPLNLVQLKQATKSPLIWGHSQAVIINNTGCYLWQDNNQVLVITTAYDLTETVIKSQKQPSRTSASATITKTIFRDSAVKDLAIPLAIDAYNHNMGGIDIANQLRASFKTLRPQNLHYWKPLFYWLLDMALTHSYLIALAITGPSKHYWDYLKF